MASTIWHTVEFSRNRRASPRDLSISSERLCRSESYLAFGPLLATRSGSDLRAGSPSPSGFRAHEAPGSTIGGGHPRDQPPWFDPRCPFLPLGRHREHYARVAAGGKSRRGDPGHQTRSARRSRRSGGRNVDDGPSSPRGDEDPPSARRQVAAAQACASTTARVRLPRRRTAHRPCSRSSAVEHRVLGRDPDVVHRRTALGDRPSRRALARHHARRREQVGDRVAGGARCATGSSATAAASVAASRSASEPRPNSAWLAATTWSAAPAPCTSDVTSYASARCASRAAGPVGDGRLELLDLARASGR